MLMFVTSLVFIFITRLRFPSKVYIYCNTFYCYHHASASTRYHREREREREREILTISEDTGMPEHDFQQPGALAEVHHLSPLVAEEGAEIEREVVFVGQGGGEGEAQPVVLRGLEHFGAHVCPDAKGV